MKAIRGNAVSATTPLDGQVYKWVNGSSEFQAKYIGIADLKKVDGSAQMPATCAANETLSWSSISDVLTCAAIGSLDGSKITTGTVAYARLPAGTAANTVAAGDDSRFGNALRVVGTNINITSLSSGQVLKFDGANWVNAADSGVGSETDPSVQAYAKNAPGAGLTVSSNTLVPDFGTTAGKVAQGNDSRFPSGTCASGNYSRWTGSAWSCDTDAASDSSKVAKVGDTMTGALNLPSNGLVVGTNQLVVSGGNIGIGTASAGEKLTVTGTIHSTIGGIKFPDGTTQTTAASGTGLAGPSFSVHKNGTHQTISAGTWTKLTWNTELFDTNNNFVSDRFTPTVAGKYIVTLNAYCITGTTVYCLAGIQKNGAWAVVGESRAPASQGDLASTATAIVDMNGTTDYLEAFIYGDGTGVNGTAHLTLFSGSLLAPLASGSVAGTGTANLLPMWSSSTNLTNSPLAVSSGNVGIGTTTPGTALDVNGGIRPGSSTVVTATCNSTNEGIQRYNYTSHVMEYCNGTTWTAIGSGTKLPGEVIAKTVYKDCTRAALTSSSSIQIASFPVNKQVASSNLLIEGTISGRGNNSGDMTQGWKLGSGTEAIAQSIMYESSIYSKAYPTTTLITSHTTTGTQTMVFRYFAQNGGAGNAPFNVYNPNSSDDARLAQTCSIYVVTEIAQ